MAKRKLGLDFPDLPYLIDTADPQDDAGTIRLTQTYAILRRSAAIRRHGLLGRTTREEAQVDVVLEAARDWIYSFFDVTYCGMDEMGNDSARETDGAVGIHHKHVPSSDGEAKEQRGTVTEFADTGSEVRLFQCAKSSPRFETLRAAYLDKKLPAVLQSFAALLADRSCVSEAYWIAGGGEPTVADFVFAEYFHQHLILTLPACRGRDLEVAAATTTSGSSGLPSIAAYRASPAFKKSLCTIGTRTFTVGEREAQPGLSTNCASHHFVVLYQQRVLGLQGKQGAPWGT